MTDRERLIDLIIEAERTDPLKGNSIVYLADYLLEHGVIVLPCKVGDTLYEIHERRNSGKWIKTISERHVNGIEVGLHNVLIARCGTTISVFLSDLGKTVFLTREEAEKALKEREQNEGFNNNINM